VVKGYMYQIKIVTYLHTTIKLKHYKTISGNEFISHPSAHSKDFFTGRNKYDQKKFCFCSS